ncbi:FAD-binding and (Fe-S)-binding domain-containing protein [Kineococcus rubinsiae]|uniref:FAD-binding and (Fe-S)-binding domain-containing protein n=1 Tax=Kineococcus rubinsiae TaxID=2609562 RepID=UPI001430CBD3|nr:FAD-binding and (Fe-S)-binding domain-containing protein [Kineococcus rubinsiae]NIZ90578.1 FAD-binding oxidoreductase [Kineococcus rubinsiae]
MTLTEPAPVRSDAAPDALGARLVAALGAGGAEVVDVSTRRRAEYTSDASNYRVVPGAVVFPRSAADVEAVFAVCRELGVPFTSRGAGTSVAGNAVGTGVVLDFSRHLNRVLEIDPETRTALIEPGVVLDDLQRAAEPFGLRFGPDPSTHARCTVGGMIGNDACGSHALAYGRTSHNVVQLEVLDGHGRRYWTDAAPAELTAPLEAVAGRHLATIRTSFGTFGRQVSGYALEHLLPETGGPRGTALARLLTGSEGTLATILRARVRLVAQSPATTFVVLGYADMASAADATPALLTHSPLAVEGIDRRLADVVVRRGGSVAGLPGGDGWLFVEMGGQTPEEALAAAHAMVADSAALDSVVIPTAAEARALWRIREDGAGLAGRSPEGQPAWPGWEDAAVPPARLGAYLREFEALMASHGVDGLAYGHFGDGCIHVRIDFPLYEDGSPARTREFLEDAARLVASHGGSLSGEHGDGRARGGLLPLMYEPEAIAAFEEVKRVFDPDDLLNPGVIVRPSPVDADLRVPASRSSHVLGMPLKFAYSHDEGDLTRAVHRCVGVGKCRADSGGVMCPSFLATGDEKDSTRGRARLLQEMANGQLVTDGWRSEEVREVLDLCLSCKGCTVDCPAGVDMPTYKAEFFDKYYAGRLRPMNHYLLGWLPRWAKLVSLAPKLVNALTAVPLLARVAKAAGGIDQHRPLPRFAETTFRAWFLRRARRTGGQPVVLWVDSFTDSFSPEVGRAAVEVLEHLGFDVSITTERVCCGLTWVSTGQLDGAKRQLRSSLDALTKPSLPQDVPIVGLEPSCTALLREDAAELLPDDPRAHALKTRVRTLAELIAEQRPEWVPPRIDAKAVVQPHCHQHAVMGFAPDQALLAKAGVDATVLSGCCGLAGNFGAEKGHYDVSVKVAEHRFLPALRERGDAVVLADGYSCRTQADNLADVRPKHLAELLADALRDR